MLVGFVSAVALAAFGIGVGMLVSQDDPVSTVQNLFSAPDATAAAPVTAASEPAVARAATAEFTTGLGQPAPSAAAEPDQMADLIMAAVAESAQAAEVQLDADPAAFTVPETATTEPEIAAVAPATTNNADLFARSSNADAQCFEDLQNLARDARVYFPAGGTTVDETGIAQARLIGLVAQTCPGVMVQVEGHSDPSGDPAVNLVLSEKRAQVVVDRIAASGIDTSVFRAVGFGDRVRSNITGPENAAYYDRRVEFSIVRSGETATAAVAAASRQLPSCVVRMQTAVEQTRVFYRPNSITASQSDLAPVFQLAATAAACPDARLRVIGHYAEGEGDGETTQTGRMRAVAMMSMIVASGFDAEQVIMAAPSSPTLMGPQGINNRRVDFDVIYDPN